MKEQEFKFDNGNTLMRVYKGGEPTYRVVFFTYSHGVCIGTSELFEFGSREEIYQCFTQYEYEIAI